MRKWLPSQVYRDEIQASSVLAFLISQYRTDVDPRVSPYVLGIELKSTSDLVGHVGLSPLHGDVEVGYAVEQSQQRKGIATEAVHAMCKWAAAKFPRASILGITAQERTAHLNEFSYERASSQTGKERCSSKEWSKLFLSLHTRLKVN